MKHIHYLYIGALALLIACSSEERITTTDSNEEPSGPIELSAGIIEGSSKATTRTAPTYQALTPNTKLALQVSGTWTEHDPVSVVKTTTATIGTASGTNNAVNFTAAETLYWDDYGSADPANATGRTTGLTIYGAAINGKTIAPSVSDWTALSWTLPANQTASESTPADKDLLISNNIKAGTGDGTYKFDSRASGKLLEFKHALSKITVVLTAGDGFVDKNGDTLLDFANDPEVKLTSNVANSSTNPEWACTKGNVNITSGGVTLTGTSSSGDPAVITMWQASSTGHVVTKEALVMPGSQFTGDDAIIARINADGNIYYVTAEKIRTAINSSTHGTDGAYSTEAGKNYIINITVNKTSIDVTATVANWTEVSATQVAPVINVSGNLGGTASGWTADNIFSFYRSEYLNSGYSSGVSKVNGFYPEESVLSYTHSPTSWSMSPSLYWPNHNTHYQFRAVWPQTVTTSGDGVLSSPRVEDGSGTTAYYQVIKVSNVAYTANSFPSDLMIARPEIDPSTLCTNKDHTNVSLYNVGICATEGTINLNFRYMMSRVDVNLTTSKSEDVDYPATVNLNNAQVEIVNVHKTGDVKLGDREVIPTGVKSATPVPATDTFGDYILGNYSYADATKTATYSSAIVPQTLTYTSALHLNNVMFRITIYKNGDSSQGVDDIYYADIQPIAVKVTGSSVSAAPVTNWESGVHYVYNLRLTKTKVQVTASLTPWTEVTATQDIWF